MMTLLAAISTTSIGQLAIYLIVIFAIVAILMIAVRAFGIKVPPWLTNVIMVVVVAAVLIIAIRFLLSL